MSETLPHIFLSFANDHTGAFLHALEPERRALRSELSIFQRNGWGYYHSSSSSATGHLIEDLQLYPRQISIFHFSGHADGESLQLESQKKEQEELHKNNLLSILEEEAQNNLQLVFLNACETKGMLEGLQELNVPAVILTDSVIPDRQAKEFSLAFYRSLLNGSSLETAFLQAKTLIDSSVSDSRVFRAINLSYLKNKKKGEEIPWGLHVQDDAVLNWRLLEGKTSNPKSETKALNKIPGSHQDFVGRDKELRELRHLLQKEKPVLLLNGIGGIGKTTLARQYLHDNYFHFDKIVWVSVLSEQLDEDKGFQTATDALGNDVALMYQLGIAFDKEQSAAERAGVILSRLRTQSGQNLLVIDNAGFSLEDIRRELPHPPNWQVLITSRKELPGLSVKRLDELPKEEALDLFYLHYPQGENEAKDVEVLMEHIGYHTLTLELFAKTCQKSPSTNPEKILKLLQERELEKLSRKVFVEHSDREVEVYSYLLAAFELHELTEEELTILIQWAVLPPMNLSWEHLCQIYGIKEEDNFVESLIGLLEKGWIEKGKTGDNYRIHQLIQEVLRYKHEPNSENCKIVILGIKNMLGLELGRDNYPDKFEFVAYGESVLEAIKEESPQIVNLQNNLALWYKEIGLYQKAVELFELVLYLDKKYLGEDDPSTAGTRSNLALVYIDLGEYKKAESLLRLALSSDIKNFDKSHPSIVRNKSNLAIVYSHLGELGKANSLWEDVYLLELKQFGEQHPSTNKSRLNFALMQKQLGNYENAKALLKLNLSFDLENFGQDHPSTNRTKANLALVYKDLGRYNEALQLLESVYSWDLRTLGIDHLSTADSRANLGNIYVHFGKYEEAAELLILALSSYEKNFGRDHPKVALTKMNLGLVYKHQGKYSIATELLETAFIADLNNFGEDHYYTAQKALNLALIYKDLEEYQKARELLEMALLSDFKSFGKYHPSTAKKKKVLASVYTFLNKKSEAKELIEAAYEAFVKKLGTNHPETQNCKDLLDELNQVL